MFLFKRNRKVHPLVTSPRDKGKPLKYLWEYIIFSSYVLPLKNVNKNTDVDSTHGDFRKIAEPADLNMVRLELTMKSHTN